MAWALALEALTASGSLGGRGEAPRQGIADFRRASANEGDEPGRDAGGAPRTPIDHGRSRGLELDALLARGPALAAEAL
eukprot:448121-Pyramimonas_sp.AAC.1